MHRDLAGTRHRLTPCPIAQSIIVGFPIDRIVPLILVRCQARDMTIVCGAPMMMAIGFGIGIASRAGGVIVQRLIVLRVLVLVLVPLRRRFHAVFGLRARRRATARRMTC
jgi:hypothetical protein